MNAPSPFLTDIPAEGALPLDVLDCGMMPYGEARLLQDSLVERRVRGETGDVLLFCEHPPTITLGLQSRAIDFFVAPERLSQLGFEVVRSSRGGRVTYHGPGQMLIYPVVSLRERRLGVKVFVLESLKAIARAVAALGLPAFACINPAGVWILRAGFWGSEGAAELPEQGAKIAAAGLRICHGVTNHGFSLNISCDLRPFSYFRPCGMDGACISSLQGELETKHLDWSLVRGAVMKELAAVILSEPVMRQPAGATCK